MSVPVKRIAVNVGGGYVPGLNAVITGTVLAANELGWEVVGIRDGFDGLLAPERYAEGGLLALTPGIVESLSAAGGAILGKATRTDPFRVRHVNAENQVEEVDRSGELIARDRHVRTVRWAEIDDQLGDVESRARVARAITDEAFGTGRS